MLNQKYTLYNTIQSQKENKIVIDSDNYKLAAIELTLINLK